jgi:PAS domain S-box-containing protein
MVHRSPPPDLRQRAEQVLAGRRYQSADRLVRELEIHQIELELQNEQLRRSELELQASRDRYFDLYDLAPVGYLTLDPGGRIVEANRTAALLLGGATAELVGATLSRYLGERDSDLLHLHRQDVAAGYRSRIEVRFHRADGSRFAALLDSMPAPGSSDRSIRMVIIDLTEKRRAEVASTRHEARLLAMLDAVVEAVLALDDGWRIVAANRATARLFGYEPAELIGLPVDALTAGGASDRSDGGLARVLAVADAWRAGDEVDPRAVFEGRRKDGTSFLCVIETQALTTGGEQSFIAVVRALDAAQVLQPIAARSR